MKLLLLITIIAICSSLPVISPYKRLNLSTAAKDPTILKLLDFGTKKLLQKGLADKKLSHDSFHLTKLSSVHMQTLNGLNYKFNVDLQDDQGMTLNSAFTMHYQPKTNEMSMGAISYALRKSHPGPQPENFFELDTSSYRQNPEVLNLLEFAMQGLLQKGFQDQTIKNHRIQFEKLQRIQREDLGVEDGSYYHFTADLKDGEGNKVLAGMTVFYDPNTGEKEMIDSSYNVQRFSSHLQLREKMDQSHNDYFNVDVAEVPENQEIQDSLNFGLSEIIQKAIGDKQIPISQYVLEKVNEVKRQVTGAGRNYWFDVLLTNQQDTTIEATFTVFTRDSDLQRAVKDYETHVETTVGTVQKPVEPEAQKYELLTQTEASEDANLQVCLEFGVASIIVRLKDDLDIDSQRLHNANIQTVEKQAVGNLEFYRFNVDLSSDDLTVSTSFTVTNNLENHEQSLKSLLYKVIPAKGDGITPTDCNGYVFIDLLDVQRVPEIKQNLEFGVVQIVTQALSDKRAPVSVYVLSEIKSAKKLMVGEISYYKFKVELTNHEGTTIDAKFTVKYNIQTIKTELKDSHYEVNTVSA